MILPGIYGPGSGAGQHRSRDPQSFFLRSDLTFELCCFDLFQSFAEGRPRLKAFRDEILPRQQARRPDIFRRQRCSLLIHEFPVIQMPVARQAI